MPKTTFECPVSECSYNETMRLVDDEKERPLILESTRSHKSEDSWRDMDHFDEDEELSRLRRAVDEVRRMLPKGFQRHNRWQVEEKWRAAALPLLSFISEAFSHIDDGLTRGGSLPKTWQGSYSVTRIRGRLESLREEAYMGQKQMILDSALSGRGVDEPSDTDEENEVVAPDQTKMPKIALLSVTPESEYGRRGKVLSTRYEAAFCLDDGMKLVVDVPKEAYETLKKRLDGSPKKAKARKKAA